MATGGEYFGDEFRDGEKNSDTNLAKSYTVNTEKSMGKSLVETFKEKKIVISEKLTENFEEIVGMKSREKLRLENCQQQDREVEDLTYRLVGVLEEKLREIISMVSVPLRATSVSAGATLVRRS